MTLKRICIDLPKDLIAEMDEIVQPDERSQLFAELLDDYLDMQSAESSQKLKLEVRRNSQNQVINRLRNYSRKAANLFLP